MISTRFIRCVISVIYFIFSIYIFSYFTEGDQRYYREFYEGVNGLDFEEAFKFYFGKLGTTEPLYFVVVYLSSNILDKDILFSLINSVLIYNLIGILNKYKISYVVQFLFAFNFYLLVLLFSAERLKLALFFLMFSFNVSSNFSFLFQGLAFFSHVQTLLLIVQPYIYKLFFLKRTYFKSFKGIVSICFVISFIFIILFIMREHISDKLNSYSGDIYSMIKPIIFMIFSVLCSRNGKILPFFQSMIFVLASLVIGGERIVIFSYLIFIYYGLSYRKGINVYVISSSLYFMIKGIAFLINIINYGDGFDPEFYVQ